MIIILKKEAQKAQIDKLIGVFEAKNFDTHISRGKDATIIGLIGDTSSLDLNVILSLDIVEDVRRVTEPYKKANRKFHVQDTIINVAGKKIGAGNFAMIAGPCSVESIDQIISVAREVKNAGANFLRGGAFKPRTSPYAFQGLEREGLDMLYEAKRVTGMPIVTEIMEISDIDLFENVDIIQVGARNMQNFRLLKELGKIRQPILLKRGLANTIEEFLMSAEYIMSEGNENVILCERGIRTFETYTRNTFDVAAIAVLKHLTHLPVIADPSHAVGIAKFVPPVAKASVAAGADGLMIEVHNDPQNAKSDGKQSLKPEAFNALMQELYKYLCLENMKID